MMLPPHDVQEHWGGLIGASPDVWCKHIDSWAEGKGWNEDYPETMTGVHIALMHSELSEAFEAWRDGLPPADVINGKPEGIAIELADCIIRIMHWFARRGLSLEQALATKMAYNETRPYRHGGKKA